MLSSVVARCFTPRSSSLSEIARVLVRLDHVASRIVNANHGIMSATTMPRVADCIAGRIWFGIPQPTEWQNIGNQIKTAMIFAGPLEAQLSSYGGIFRARLASREV
jgi:hypothetical protein